MNKSTTFLALALLPLSLAAQTKSSVRKPAPTTQRNTARPAARPAATRPPAMVRKPAPAPQASVSSAEAQTPAPAPAASPAPAIVASAKPAPAEQPAVAATKPAQPARASSYRPAAPDRGQTSAFRFGIRLGMSAATATDLGPDVTGGNSVDPVTGFHGGVVMSFGRRAFTMQPEILYSQYGFKISSGTDYIQAKYNVVEVPLMLKYTFGQSNTRFFVNLGPTATYLLGGKFWVRAGGEVAEGNIELGPNDGRLNYGGSFGVGASRKAGPGRVQIEARSTYLTTADSDAKLLGGKLSIAYLLR